MSNKMWKHSLESYVQYCQKLSERVAHFCRPENNDSQEGYCALQKTQNNPVALKSRLKTL